jgi:DNA polymerase I-like protein with 3'-5' exonuclease and polymerase domains
MSSINLAAHIAALRAKKETEVQVAEDAIIFWGTSFDKDYLSYLKPCVGSATTFLRMETVTTLTTVKMYCSQKKVFRVISTSLPLLERLLGWDKKKAPSLKDYAGSYFKIAPFKEGEPDIEIVFIAPLKQLVTVNYGRFMATRQISKLTKKDKWFKPSKFNGYTLLTPANESELHADFAKAFLIAVDVETVRDNAQIKCISYTAFFYNSFEESGMESTSVELALDSEFALAVMRKWNNLPAPKVMQNGKYDAAYFFRYSAPLHNYLYDTANFFHCWYSELPKDLGFLNSFFIREAFYWKDLAETNDLDVYYRYNSLDTWGTGNTFLAMLLEAPQWAVRNYLLEFPLTFPCHMCEMRGIKRDMTKLQAAIDTQQAIIADKTTKLNKILSIPAGKSFNVKSSPQMKSLFKLLGCQDLPSCDEKHLKKARYRHPFNARVLNLVTDIREARTLIEKYLQTGDKAKEFKGRILFALNPHGTDSARLASREHHFWTGLQIQNIPKGPIVKSTIQADEGFYLCEVDLEQAESRDTAYISGDETLIHNVEFSPDFHCANASAFFGVPFNELYDVTNHKVLNKDLRNLAKPVNHGANYNMGAYVLIDSMGEENIVKAKLLLNLPRFWSYKQTSEHLLDSFHKTYPKIKTVFYAGVVKEICATRMLVSKAVHHSWHVTSRLPQLRESNSQNYEAQYNKQTGAWTRYCFGHPDKNKPDLNSYIAHPPQSLNAQTLNKAFLTVFNDIANNPKHSDNFKLIAQIHDSILFQYREGHAYLCDMVKERMEIPLTIKAYDGEIRTFVVPAGIKNGKHLESKVARYWSETE